MNIQGSNRRNEKMHTEELHKFYCSLNIIRMIKSRRKKWVGHVARVWKPRDTTFWSENSKVKDQFRG
jgi:hypothetical protein